MRPLSDTNKWNQATWHAANYIFLYLELSLMILNDQCEELGNWAILEGKNWHYIFGEGMTSSDPSVRSDRIVYARRNIGISIFLMV